ncbi:MAG: NAD(P)-dependent oxidoreductase [Candidatus Poribacteria bacterium]|nr:NAD(P)-dependent oxidoreductase [Candidatus Poribacteria bacterium]
MKVVVFGGAGWLGRAVLANLTGKHQIRAFDRDPTAWETWKDTDGEWQDGEIVHGDLVNFADVHNATEGVDAIIHVAVYFWSEPGGYGEDDQKPFLINLKGLWNVLESARQRGIKRVVHIGSCQTVHPEGIFFTSEVRRPDGSLYAVCKRLQEEMCRQFYEAHGLRIIVLRPDYIVDSRLGMGRHREKLGPDGRPARNGWVCRHDLAEACRLAAESEVIDFDIFHIVGTPEADKTCNVARSRRVLGLTYKGDLEQYR